MSGGGGGAARGAARRVLVIEDDADARTLMAQVLRIEGYEVAAAANGREALELLRPPASPPAVILIDLMMPEMNGLEFRSAQLGDPRLAAIPLLVISGDRLLDQQAAAVGAAGWLRKPIELDALLAAVHRHAP